MAQKEINISLDDLDTLDQIQLDAGIAAVTPFATTNPAKMEREIYRENLFLFQKKIRDILTKLGRTFKPTPKPTELDQTIPILRIEFIKSAQLGRTYTSQTYRVTSQYDTGPTKLTALFNQGFFGVGQEFSILTPVEEAKVPLKELFSFYYKYEVEVRCDSS